MPKKNCYTPFTKSLGYWLATIWTSKRPGHLLQPTALINEAYLRLAKQRDTDWQKRTHFFAAAAQAMRRILMDYARNANARRRGGGLRPISLESDLPYREAISSEILAVSQALNRLSSLHPAQAKVVELKYFGGTHGRRDRCVSRPWSAHSGKVPEAG
jgi:RNA polymerase sigma factor (TIGR02999 family)